MSINIRFPIEDDTIKNHFFKMNNVSKDAVSSNLMLLLLTEKGTRYYMPDYGTYLIKYMFEPNDNITIKDVENDVKETVSKFMPDIKIIKLEHTIINETENVIDVIFGYKSMEFGGVEQLQIVF